MTEAEFKQRRARMKAALSRLNTSLEQNLAKNEIVLRMQRLDQLYLDFDNIDTQLPEKESEIEEFEKKFFETKVKFQNKLDLLCPVAMLVQIHRVIEIIQSVILNFRN